MSSTGNCTVPANPDVTGIGVRASLYGQAILALITFGLICVDRQVTKQEEALLRELSRTLIWTYCGLTINGFVQIGLHDLDFFHSVVLRYLCWINAIVILPLEFVLSTSCAPGIGLCTLIVYLFLMIAQPVLGLLITGMVGSLDPESHIVKDCGDRLKNAFSDTTIQSEMAAHQENRIGYPILLAIGAFTSLVFIVIYVKQRMIDLFEQWFFPISRGWTAAFRRFSSKKYYWPVVYCFTIGSLVGVVFLAVTVELVIIKNASFLQPDEENKWTFGQTLAIIMLGVPTWTAVQQGWSYWRESRQTSWVREEDDVHTVGLMNDLERADSISSKFED